MSIIDLSIIPLEEFKREGNQDFFSNYKNVNEFFFVTKGYLVRTLNFFSIRVNSREVHISLDGQLSSLSECSEDIAGFYCAFSNEFTDEVYWDDIMKDLTFINSFMFRYPLRLFNPVFERLKYGFSILSELNQSFAKNKPLIIVYLTTVICEIKQLLLQLDSNTFSTKSFWITKRYQDLLTEYTSAPQDISHYASLLGITPNHLNKSVKATTGKTAISLKNEMMLLEAKIQLKQSHVSISEIAFNLGFSDLSYFSRFFKKGVGLSPQQYRNG